MMTVPFLQLVEQKIGACLISTDVNLLWEKLVLVKNSIMQCSFIWCLLKSALVCFECQQWSGWGEVQALRSVSKCLLCLPSAMRYLQVLCRAFKCYAVPASAVRCLQGVWGVWKWMLSEPPLVRYNSWRTVVRYRNLYLIISNKMFPLQVNRGASKAPH